MIVMLFKEKARDAYHPLRKRDQLGLGNGTVDGACVGTMVGTAEGT